MSQEFWAGPFFDPPYDSPIEEAFALGAIKYLRTDAALQKQVQVPTIVGTFRLDFVIAAGSRRVGIECDGKEFHESWRDEVRDAMIFGAGAIDVMYRLRGCDIVYHLEDLLVLLANWEEQAFTDRARLNLDRIATQKAKNWLRDEPSNGAFCGYPDGGMLDLNRSVRVAPPSKRVHWPSIFRRATAYFDNGGRGGLDGLLADIKIEQAKWFAADARLAG